MAKILTVTNQKGGVGKTTTCVNLAASLAATKKRVLLIDMDPQGNATMGSGMDKGDLMESVYDVLIDGMAITDAIVDAEAAGYHLLGSNAELTGAEIEGMIQGKPAADCEEAAGATRIKRLRDALGNQMVSELLVKNIARRGYVLAIEKDVIRMV